MHEEISMGGLHEKEGQQMVVECRPDHLLDPDSNSQISSVGREATSKR